MPLPPALGLARSYERYMAIHEALYSGQGAAWCAECGAHSHANDQEKLRLENYNYTLSYRKGVALFKAQALLTTKRFG